MSAEPTVCVCATLTAKSPIHHQTGVTVVPSIVETSDQMNAAIDAALATGAPYIALWDDNTLYAPNHLQAAVELLESDPSAVATGQSKALAHYMSELWTLPTIHPRHAHAASLVFRREWLLPAHRRFSDNPADPAASLLDNYEALIAQAPLTLIHTTLRPADFAGEKTPWLQLPGWATYDVGLQSATPVY